jgi:hypothetical protein
MFVLMFRNFFYLIDCLVLLNDCNTDWLLFNKTITNILSPLNIKEWSGTKTVLILLRIWKRSKNPDRSWRVNRRSDLRQGVFRAHRSAPNLSIVEKEKLNKTKRNKNINIKSVQSFKTINPKKKKIHYIKWLVQLFCCITSMLMYVTKCTISWKLHKNCKTKRYAIFKSMM